MSRNGKIARLPRDIRQQLNHRLQDGEEGGKLAAWLNGLPRVQQVLKEHFGDRPINAVNLHEWRKGGFLEWERYEEARELVENLAQRAADLGEDATGTAISDGVACLMSVELAMYVESVRRDTAEPKKRWEILQGLMRQVTQLRREDHRATRVRIERERWEVEVKQRKEEERERERAEERERRLAPFNAIRDVYLRSQEFGGDLKAKQLAAHILEIERDLPPGSLTSRYEESPKHAEEPPATPEPNSEATTAARNEPRMKKKTKKRKVSRKRAARPAQRLRSRRPRVSKKQRGAKKVQAGAQPGTAPGVRPSSAPSSAAASSIVETGLDNSNAALGSTLLRPGRAHSEREKAAANALEQQPADAGLAEPSGAPDSGEEDGQAIKPN